MDRLSACRISRHQARPGGLYRVITANSEPWCTVGAIKYARGTTAAPRCRPTRTGRRGLRCGGKWRAGCVWRGAVMSKPTRLATSVDGTFFLRKEVGVLLCVRQLSLQVVVAPLFIQRFRRREVVVKGLPMQVNVDPCGIHLGHCINGEGLPFCCPSNKLLAPNA